LHVKVFLISWLKHQKIAGRVCFHIGAFMEVTDKAGLKIEGKGGEQKGYREK